MVLLDLTLNQEILISVGLGLLTALIYYIFSLCKNTEPCKDTQKEITQITITIVMAGFVVLSYFSNDKSLDFIVIRYKMILLASLVIVIGIEINKAFRMIYEYRNKTDR